MTLKQIIKLFFNQFGYKIINEKGRNRLKKETEYNKFRMLERFKFKSIIDVGANEGQFALRILTLYPTAVIDCYEPIHSVFERLRTNLANYPNASCFNFGLGESYGEVDINVNEYSPSSSLLPMLDLHRSNFDYAVKVTPNKIQLRTLDSFYPAKIIRPLLIKIDVQGYEMFVLKGGHKVIDQADVIIIETSFQPLYEGEPLFEDIYKHLFDMGFIYSGNVDQLYSPQDGAILQADAIFIKRRFSAITF